VNRRFSRALGLAAIAACGVLAAAGAAPAGAAAPTPAPLLAAPDQAVPGRYVVVLDGEPAASGASAAKAFQASVAQAKSLGADVSQQYRHAVNGYAATLTAGELAAVRQLPGVAYVSEDRKVDPPATQSPTPSWGLDRIDQRSLPLDSSYSYPNAAPGVVAYLLDTGIRATHTEFTGRVLQGYNVINTGAGGAYQSPTDTSDCYGHGTHVAGTFAGTTYGVAKQALMVPVRVYGCGGSSSSEWIAGIDWITADHAANPTRKLALGEIQSSGPDAPLDAAIQASIDSGVVWVSAAGNSALDSCTVSIDDIPANIVVGSSNSNDQPAGDSQWGACVDVYAPGVGITSALNGSDTDYATWSGTSMAAPHVLGVVAQYLYTNPSATPAQVQTAIVNGATSGVLSGLPPGSPNKLVTNYPDAPQPSPTFAVQAGNLAPAATTDNSIRTDLRVRANGGLPVDLSKVTLRYWFTRDGGANTYQANCDWAVIGCSNLVQTVVNLPTARTGADAYLQVGFTTSAGTISGSATSGQTQLRLNKTDWSNFSEAADHSYRNTATVADFTKVTGYYNGVLVWGVEP
jgi:subtilisin family serine protease